MNEKLKTLLDKIGLDDKYYVFFEKGKIEKLLINKEQKIWQFVIHIENILPTDVLKEFEIGLIKTFDELKDVYASFSYDNITDASADEYFKYILEKLSLSNMFSDSKTDINDSILSVHVLNKIELSKLNKEKAKMEELLRKYGFNLSISIMIDDVERNRVKASIAADTAIEVAPVKQIDPQIVGVEIKSKHVLPLRDIIEEEPSVIVEASVFAIELKEIAGKDYKIVLLKLNDRTDSLNAKFFTRSSEDFETMASRVKVGNWYKIRGSIKNDTYMHDMVLNIRDMEEIPSRDVIRMDEAEEKRVELHTHTHMSQMDGVVDIITLAKRAALWGHKAIAVTDHNCCQAFTDAYHKVKG
ncbi:MAG: PolC-type DNA polymerase III N-terminal domain-containing protein, partial [Bacilli bacterium]